MWHRKIYKEKESLVGEDGYIKDIPILSEIYWNMSIPSLLNLCYIDKLNIPNTPYSRIAGGKFIYDYYNIEKKSFYSEVSFHRCFEEINARFESVRPVSVEPLNRSWFFRQEYEFSRRMFFVSISHEFGNFSISFFEFIPTTDITQLNIKIKIEAISSLMLSTKKEISPLLNIS